MDSSIRAQFPLLNEVTYLNSASVCLMPRVSQDAGQRWREGVYHGPAGTDTGYNLFVRTVNGPLVNHFAAEPKSFTWDPEYRPVLPPDLARHARPYVAPVIY